VGVGLIHGTAGEDQNAGHEPVMGGAAGH